MKIISLDKYFTGKVKTNSSKLRKKLINFGFKDNKCEICGIENWMGCPAPLELHHKNGNHHDNKLENLQILCANCHGQIPNHSKNKWSRVICQEDEEKVKDLILKLPSSIRVIESLGLPNEKRYQMAILRIKEKFNLSFLKNPIIKKQKSVFAKKRRKVERPSKEKLLELVWLNSILSLSKRFKVSGNAIKKWAKIYNIPVPPRGYWAKLEHGYDLECLEIKKNLFVKFKIEW